MEVLNSQDIYRCISELGTYIEDNDANYKSMNVFSSADPIDELPDDTFYLVHAIDREGQLKPKKKNTLVFSIGSVERLEVASKSVNEELSDSNAVALDYPYFGGSFVKFEKRKNKKGKLQHCGVASTFSSEEALKKFLNYLASGRELNNNFDGYYLNHRKLTHIESLLNDLNALIDLIEEIGLYFGKAIPFKKKSDRPNIISEEITTKVFKCLCFIDRTKVTYGISDYKEGLNTPKDAEMSFSLEYIATLISLARTHVGQNQRLVLGELYDEYGERKKFYCELKETVESIGLYLLTRIDCEQTSLCIPKLRELYKVPEHMFSLQQLALFLGVQEKSLNAFLKQSDLDGIPFRNKLVTHKDYGNRKKFLPRDTFLHLLSSVNH